MKILSQPKRVPSEIVVNYQPRPQGFSLKWKKPWGRGWLITEEKRLIEVAALHLQKNHMEDAGNFFVFLFPFWEARDLKVGV